MNRSSVQVSCLIATMLLAVNDARADNTTSTMDVVNVPAGNDKIVPMHKGEAAPLDGQLFDNDTALRWANWLVQYKSLVKRNSELEQKLCALDVGLANQKLQIEQEKNNKIVPDLEKKLADAQAEIEHPAFYKTFWFGTTIGVTVATLATVAIVAAVHQ